MLVGPSPNTGPLIKFKSVAISSTCLNLSTLFGSTPLQCSGTEIGRESAAVVGSVATAAGLSSFSWNSVATPPPNHRSPTRARLGTVSLSTSSLFVFSSGDKLESPVTLPPGRARLATKPAPTGSPMFVITMGIVVVALLAANAGAVPETTI